jgi:hypothetical protein
MASSRGLWVKTAQLREIVLPEYESLGLTEFSRQSGMSARRVTALVNCETEFTKEEVADRTLISLGLPHRYCELEFVDRYKPKKSKEELAAYNREWQRKNRKHYRIAASSR